MSDFTIERDIDQITAQQLLDLYGAVGWNETGHRDVMNVQDALKRSESIAYVRDGDKIVAFGRILTNGFYGYIHDVMTHPDYRRKGMAAEIIEALMNFGRSRYPYVKVISAGGYEDFYKKFDMGTPKTETVFYKVFKK